ncbi:MAG: helix-turn-helix domain-containing protein, partial [Candidatus Pacearchaeota archaeon]
MKNYLKEKRIKKAMAKYDVVSHVENMNHKYFEVAKTIAELQDIDVEAMFLPIRFRELADARILFCLWLKAHTRLTLKQIGVLSSVTTNDHTTVIHRLDEGKDLIKTEETFRNKWNKLNMVHP